MVKPKRRRSRVADYVMCFGVAAWAPEVIHGEQITLCHQMRAWLFLNRSPSRRWWYGHLYCDTCVLTQRWHNVMCCLWHRDTYHVSRYTGHDTYADTYRDTIRVSPGQVSRCIDTTLGLVPSGCATGTAPLTSTLSRL